LPALVTERLLAVILLLAASKCFGQTSVWRSPVPRQQEAFAWLRAVCPSSAVQLHTGATPAEPGCKPCPEYTTIGSVQPEMAVHRSFDIETVIYGSFTMPGAEEAVANFGGCEPHASGNGGSVLLRKLRESWKMVNYTRGLLTSNCKNVPHEE